MDQRLSAHIPEGLEAYSNKRLITGDPEIRDRITRYIFRRFTPQEIRQRVADEMYAIYEVPLIVEYYPELADLHEDLILEFLARREKAMKFLNAIERMGEI